MNPPSAGSALSPYLALPTLQTMWQQLNVRYFSHSLPSITIRWSRRLTSSVGMFISRGRPKASTVGTTHRSHREIRLSLPLFVQLVERTPSIEQELLNTLAHEMTHQWQFDVLKRRPNHGLDFLRKMTEINRSGEVSITTYHCLEKEVLALSRFAWRCTDCGRVYRRQRKTIQPTHHHCGACQGPLQEIPPPFQEIEHQPRTSLTQTSGRFNQSARRRTYGRASEQLTFTWL